MSEERRRNDKQPDPEFVSRLEWQLRSEFRREHAFEIRSRRRVWLRAAATVVLSLALGFATATAAQQIDDRNAGRYLRMEAEGQLELAELRVRWAAEMIDELAGQLEPEDLRRMQWDLQQVRWDRDQLALQLEEINAVGAKVRRELTAPTVGGRDFVSAHLQHELRRTELFATMLRDEVGRQQDADTVASLRAEMEQLASQRKRVGKELELRAAFLAGSISAEQILSRQRVERATARLAAARSRIDRILRWQQDLQQRHLRGEADRRDLLAADYELAAARLDSRLARFEMRAAGTPTRPQ